MEQGIGRHAQRWRAADSMKSSGAHPALLLAPSGTVCGRERLRDLYVPIIATLLLHTRPCFVIDIRAFRRRVRARHERRTLLRQAHRPKLRGRRVWKSASFAKRAMNLDTASLQRHGTHHKPADDVGTAVASAVQDSGQRQPVRVAAENEPLPHQGLVCVEQLRSPVRAPLSSTDMRRRCVEELVCAELCFLSRSSSRHLAGTLHMRTSCSL